MKVIETERLILRPFTVEDAPAMFERWASDPEVTKYLTWQPHESVNATRAYLTDLVSKYGEGELDWAIERKGVGLIGSIGVVDYREATEAAEIGYCMSRAYWGRASCPKPCAPSLISFSMRRACVGSPRSTISPIRDRAG